AAFCQGPAHSGNLPLRLDDGPGRSVDARAGRRAIWAPDRGRARSDRLLPVESAGARRRCANGGRSPQDGRTNALPNPEDPALANAMRLYLDDDLASAQLVQILTKAGHDVRIPKDEGMEGKADALHFAHAIGHHRVLLSRNYTDFENLHVVVMA